MVKKETTIIKVKSCTLCPMSFTSYVDDGAALLELYKCALNSDIEEWRFGGIHRDCPLRKENMKLTI